MSLSATVQAMAEAGCSPAQIAAVVTAHESASEKALAEKRAKGAERKRRSRAKNAEAGHAVSRDVTRTDCDGADKVSPSFPSSSFPPIPPLSTTPQSSPSKNARERASRPLAEFENEFWTIYPNKVGKDAARKSWERAVSRASVSEIIAGLRKYVAKTDDRPWCNPATWLNQGRWQDEAPALANANVLPFGTDPPKRDFSEAERAAAAERWKQELARQAAAK